MTGWLQPGVTDKDIDDAINEDPEEASYRLSVQIASLRRQLVAVAEALDEVEGYFEQRQDADCVGDPPRFVPNEEMRLLTLIKQARNTR